jgi:hypothetical protein
LRNEPILDLTALASCDCDGGKRAHGGVLLFIGSMVAYGGRVALGAGCKPLKTEVDKNLSGPRIKTQGKLNDYRLKPVGWACD